MKWSAYGEGVLPLWVADMDFAAPEPVIAALKARIEHGVFGYSVDLPELKAVVAERLLTRHNWNVSPEAVVLLPGLVSGLNVVCRAIGNEGDGVLVNTPVYPPFLMAPGNQGRNLQFFEQRLSRREHLLAYDVDFDAMASAITPETRLFILCNPHNPTGRAFTRKELEQIAEICARNDIVICSDEIHCDLMLGGAPHHSIAALDPEIGKRTITLIAPSKTFNIPGLACSMAIVEDPELRSRMRVASQGIVPHVNTLGMHASLAAYQSCDHWLAALLDYLTGNRDLLVQFVREQLPSLSITNPEATYLAWIDCRAAGFDNNPHRFFLKQARVALNDGRHFGSGGEGFVRLNFGCPRSVLMEALERMKSALESLSV